MAEDTAEGLKDAVRLIPSNCADIVDEVVRSSVEETLKPAAAGRSGAVVRGEALRALRRSA